MIDVSMESTTGKEQNAGKNHELAGGTEWKHASHIIDEIDVYEENVYIEMLITVSFVPYASYIPPND